MSLTTHSVRALRQNLFQLPKGFATFHTLGAGTRSALEPASIQQYGSPGCKGPITMEHFIHRESLAMAVCHVSRLHHAEPYGGYIREMQSGKPFRDIDICFTNVRDIITFKAQLVSLLSLIFGEAKHKFELSMLSEHNMSMPKMAHRSGEYPFRVHRHTLKWDDVVVHLDLTHQQRMKSCTRIPATLGSSLIWTRLGIQITMDQDLHLTADVAEVCALLAAGKDIPLFPSCQYWTQMEPASLTCTQSYYEIKHQHLQHRGYTLLASRGTTLKAWAEIHAKSVYFRRRYMGGLFTDEEEEENDSD